MLAAAVAITLVALLLFVYSAAIRPWHMQWGASHLDRVAQLPGDELSPHASSHITRAITIEAPPEAIWPALEAAVQSIATRSSMVVALSQPPQAIALCSAADLPRIKAGDEALDAMRLFFLKPQAAGNTRLLVRRRAAFTPGVATHAGDFFVAELARFAEERKMMLAIKASAEKQA